jgi:hypothetical protein
MRIFSLLIIVLLAGCGEREEQKVNQRGSNIPNVKEYCYQGISYFGVYINAIDPPYLTGAVIDNQTMQPKRCDE